MRVGGPLPAVDIVDLRADGGYPLTRPLVDALAGIDDHGGRAILLQNRRGAAAAIHCRTCGRTWRCDRCDVALTLHGRRLVCHHCGADQPLPRACSTCGSVDLAHIGAGTTRVEDELVRRFPRLEVMRLDADVAARPGEPESTLQRFRRATAAVLVGTQLVAKGHDMPGVGLAAVLDADLALAIPDFRAEERTFALLTQLAGRPGRPGDPRGRVLIQTWSPELRPVVLAARHAVAEFIEGELERRRELDYPPFRRLVRVLATAGSAGRGPRRRGGHRGSRRAGALGRHRARPGAADAAARPQPQPRADQDDVGRPRRRGPARPPARPRPRSAPGGGNGGRRRRPAIARMRPPQPLQRPSGRVRA